MSHQKSVIQFKNVSFSYIKNPLLLDVSFEIHYGDFVGIVGPNGGGKTTLLNLLLGELKPLDGNILVLSQSPIVARTSIGYLSQRLEVDLDFPISAYDIVLFGRVKGRLLHFYSEEDRSSAELAMKEMNVWDLKDRTLKDLSGGERQRVFLARALVTRPKVLVLDEPLVNVDSNTQIEFYNILSKLNREGMTILIVDHNLDMLTDYVTKVLCINKCEQEHIHLHDLKDLSKEEILKL